MSKRKSSLLVCAIMSLFISFCSFAEKPNIIFILADDLGWTDINCRPLQKDANEIDGYAREIPGDPNSNYIYDSNAEATPAEDYDSTYYQTPNLSRLREMGMRFTNAYAASPACTPTRASIMTGRYPAEVGVRWVGEILHQDYDTIAKELPDDYRTAYIGKWQLEYQEAISGSNVRHPEQRGYDLVVGGRWGMGARSYFHPFIVTAGSTEDNFRHFLKDSNGVLNEDPDWFSGQTTGTYLTDLITNEAVNFIKNDNGGYGVQSDPFFLFLSHYAVHDSYDSNNSEYNEALEATLDDFNNVDDPPGGGYKHQNKVYAAMMRSLDRSVGDLLGCLEDEQLLNSDGTLNNTYIFFFSDNGGHEHPTHGYYGQNRTPWTTPLGHEEEMTTDNAPLLGGKMNIYEGGIRVPMIVAGPDIAGNDTCNEPVSSIDFFPTIMTLAESGYSDPCHLIDGVDLDSLFDNPDTTLDRVLGWQCQFPSGYTKDIAEKLNYAAAIREGKYKLIRQYPIYFDHPVDEYSKVMLFDLENDLGETADLSEIYPEKTKELEIALDVWLASVEQKQWHDNHERYVYNKMKKKWDSTIQDSTIQDAINNSDSGDEIIVMPLTGNFDGQGVYTPGHYNEDITINKDITLRSLAPENSWFVENTVIDGTTNAVTINNTSGEATLHGLTVADSFTGVQISSNASDAHAQVRRCILKDNSMGVVFFGQNVQVSQCRFENNDQGLDLCGASNSSVRNNLFVSGDKGITCAGNDSVEISNNTIVNQTNVGIDFFGGQAPTITNCILWNNTDDLNGCSATYSCIEDGDAGTGNISTDPDFVDAANDDYHLKADSPCIDAGDNSVIVPGDVDLDGHSRISDYQVDMGADEYPGLIAEWELDSIQGNTLSDSSGNQYDGTFYNRYLWKSGMDGDCLNFTGDDYVEIVDYKGILGSDARTCCAWIKPADTNANMAILSWGDYDDDGVDGDSWIFRVKNKQLEVGVWGGYAKTDYPYPNGLCDGNWHHVAAVMPAGATVADIKLYIDGVDYTSTPETPDLPIATGTSNNVFIGARDSNTLYFDGSIDDARIYSTALSSTDISDLYNLDSITTNAAAHWKLDENLDDTIGTNDGTFYDTDDTEIVDKYTDGYLSFDGDDSIEVSGFTGIEGGNARTCCAWIQIDSTFLDRAAILHWGDMNIGTGRQWIFRIGSYWSDTTNSKLELGVGGGVIRGSTVLNNGQWHHIAVVLPEIENPNLSDVLLYVGGQEESCSFYNYDTALGTPDIDTSDINIVRIGAKIIDGPPDLYFDGNMKDVRIYNRALTEEEIQSLLPPIAHWKLDGDATDSSGNGHHGSLVGNPQWTTGIDDGAIELDGASDSIDCGNDSGLDLPEHFSICAWVNTSHTSETQAVISKGTNYVIDILSLSSGGYLRFFGYDSGTAKGLYDFTSGYSIADGQWHHIVGTFDGTTWRLYDNGNIYATKNQSASLSAVSESLQLGYRQTDYEFTGQLDDVRIYDRVLNHSEIQVLANQ